jgi:hypothetical protein
VVVEGALFIEASEDEGDSLFTPFTTVFEGKDAVSTKMDGQT